MTAQLGFTTVKHLIRDTFRQARASGISWMMLGVTAICVAFCLSVKIQGDIVVRGGDEPPLFLPAPLPPSAKPPPAKLKGIPPLEIDPEKARHDGVETIRGQMTLAFGAVAIPLTRERSDAVHFVELVLAGGIAGTFGLLLTLVWTAGFVPTFLEPRAVSVLLAKPVERWQLLLGKYLGVLTFVGFQVVVFVTLTWLALGVRTRIWDVTYLWCIPLLVLQFAIFYTFSVLLGVMTRSTVACVFGSVLFWLMAWGINYGCVMARNMPDQSYLPSGTLVLTDAAYWISPKPIDAGVILFNALDAQHHFDKPAIFKLVESNRSFSPRLSILSCLAITILLLAMSAYEFKETDY